MKNRTKTITLFIILFIAVAGAILPNRLGNLDEIWNYNFARNVVDGLVPYRDFNMVQMPLSPFIGAIFLALFSNELMVMRILGIILGASILLVTYKILEKLIENQYFNYLCILFLFLLFSEYICFDYNFLVLLLILIIILWEIKRVQKDEKVLEIHWKQDIILGLLAGLAVTIKQNTGLLLVVVFVGYKWLFIRSLKDLRTAIQISLIRGISSLVPFGIVIVYLIGNNALNDFINYCILGIKTFTNYIPYANLMYEKPAVKILAILVPMTYLMTVIIAIKTKWNTKQSKELVILFLFALTSIVIIYPIADAIHFLIGSLPAIILLAYFIYTGYHKYVKSKKIQNMVQIIMESTVKVCTIAIIILSVINMVQYSNKLQGQKAINHYRYIDSIHLQERIEELQNYILQQKSKGSTVLILDATAAIYNIPLDTYYKNYDMLLKGNLGEAGAQGVIEQLKAEPSDTKILILKDLYRRNWQTPLEVIDYIKENMRKVDQISIFDIYEK